MTESEEDVSKTSSDSEDEFVVKGTKAKNKVKKNNSKSKKLDNKSKKAETKAKKPEKDKSVKKTPKRQAKDDKKPKRERETKKPKATPPRKPREPKGPKVKEEKSEPVSNFNKVGQRYITPPPGDGTRGFYESLYEENPNSLIAIKFCVEYGIFGGKKHNEVLAKYTLLQKNGHFKGTVGAIKPSAISFLQKHNKVEKC